MKKIVLLLALASVCFAGAHEDKKCKYYEKRAERVETFEGAKQSVFAHMYLKNMKKYCPQYTVDYWRNYWISIYAIKK